MSEVDPMEIEPVAGGASGFRVIRLGEPLRRALRTRREATGQTVRAFLAEAVEHELPTLVAALGELGLSAVAGPAGRPARLPLSAAHLSALRDAASTSGLPGSLLLRAAIARLARRRRRRLGADREATHRSRTPGKAGAGAAGAKGPARPQRRLEVPREANPAPDTPTGTDTPED